jgi:hypothetical protein
VSGSVSSTGKESGVLTGTGKVGLFFWFLERVEEAGGSVLEGQCGRGTTIKFWLWGFRLLFRWWGAQRVDFSECESESSEEEEGEHKGDEGETGEGTWGDSEEEEEEEGKGDMGFAQPLSCGCLGGSDDPSVLPGQ